MCLLNVNITHIVQCVADRAVRSIKFKENNMNKLGALVIAVIAVVLVICYQNLSIDVEPEVMAEDVWWGPESGRDAAAKDRDIRPFQINITGKVN